MCDGPPVIGWVDWGVLVGVRGEKYLAWQDMMLNICVCDMDEPKELIRERENA